MIGNLKPEIDKYFLSKYPNEACGFVINDGSFKFIPVENISSDPINSFLVSDEELAKILITYKNQIEIFIHSHPVLQGEKPQYSPSKHDMESQIIFGIPFGIIVCDKYGCSDLISWGDTLPIKNPIGRKFLHGVNDCYSLIRDVYRLGKEGCAEFDIDWPFEPILLPEVPRDDDWWGQGENLYVDYFEKFGFKEINISEVKAGDIFMIKLKSDKINHAGLMIGGDQLLHHLPDRLSRREISCLWGNGADKWIRYTGNE